jgi:sugar phosphate permease
MAGIFYGWWIVLASFLIATYTGGACFFGLTAFFEPMVEEFGWSYTQVSIAFSLRGLEMGILAPIMGFLVDRLGPRRLAFSGALVVGCSLILLSLTNSLVMFYGALVLLGVGTGGCASTVLMTGVAHWFRKNVGKAMGIVTCGFGVGGVLILLIVWLIDLYGWRTTLIILGLGMWALGIPLSLVIRHRPEPYGYLPDGKPLVELDTTHGGPKREEEDSYRDILRKGNFWRLAIADGIRMMITASIIIHVMPYLSSIGMSRPSAAYVAMAIPLVSIIGRFGFGWLSDIYDKRHVLAGTYCLFGIGILAFSSLDVKWLFLPFFLIFPPAFGGCVSLRGAILREYFGAAAFGKLFGIMLGMAAIGGIIGPSLTGWTFDTLGSYRPVWLSFAGTIAIAAVLILRVESPSAPSPQS